MGGLEEHVLLLGRGLVERGFRVAAICSSRPEIEPLRHRLTTAGVEVHELAERHGSKLAGLARLRALVRTLRRYPACVLHIHSPAHNGGDLALIAGLLAGVSTIIRTEHGTSEGPPAAANRARIRVRDLLLSRIIWVCEPATWDRQARLKRAPSRYRVVPNAVDLARFSTDVAPNGVRSELGIDAHAPIVGTIARLAEYRKGIHRFLEMAQLVRGVRPDTRFLVVGDGPLRPELELQADQLGIRDSIVFAGERRDVPRLLAAMQVFVMPSLSESGPITVLEALSMGTPVVSTRVGIVPTVIVDRVDGRLTDPGDSAELASAVLELLSDQVTAGRLGLAGREVVHARFGPDALVDGVAEIYREVA